MDVKNLAKLGICITLQIFLASVLLYRIAARYVGFDINIITRSSRDTYLKKGRCSTRFQAKLDSD